MLKTILLPIDGSPLAERAIPYAAALAHRSGARVVLIQAVHATPLHGDDVRDEQNDTTQQAEQHLADAARRLASEGMSVETRVYDDDPVHAILDAADLEGADLIVMSTHGRGGIGRMLYGSVADRVLRHATVPVLLVPSIVSHPWSSDRPLSLLVPLDGSELAGEALLSAELLAETFESRVTLLQVIQAPTYPLYGEGYVYVPYDDGAEVADARQYLDGLAAGLPETLEVVETKVAVGEPARTIAEAAREAGADVIVMTTHGHGGLRRLILGSVATSTLHQSTVPLLLLRPLTMHQADSEHTGHAETEAMGSVTTTLTAPDSAQTDSELVVRLNPVDLELIECGLKALAYAPGYDYGHVRAARALAMRLRERSNAEVGEPLDDLEGNGRQW